MERSRLWMALGAMSLIVGSSCGGSGQDPAADRADLIRRAGAPLFDGMGPYHRPITTTDAGAQRYFDQGMVLSFGFNHAEAVRSFRAAQKLDPTCAMCFWGEALATGPNINVTSKGKAIMSPEERVAAYVAAQKAMSLRGSASPIEQALIGAQATRYDGTPDSDRNPQDRAYAAAMKAVVTQFPTDDDAQAMYAESWMNTMPWDYWSANGEPKPETVAVIDALEAVLARSPNHPLALHLYIHAVEASANPGRAEKAADTLATLVPGAGHLVHMPGHIFWRLGRYHDASEANVRAAQVDESYIAQCNAQGFYPAAYYPHNIHFLWAAATMEGRSAVALEAARKVAANVRMEQLEAFPTIEFFKTIPILALVQFSRWSEVIAEPKPAESLHYSTAIWHYARGVAFANTGDVAGARAERRALVPLKATHKILNLDGNDYPASDLLAIADALLQGAIAVAQGNLKSGIAAFTQAVALQDALPYTEPPFWYYPTRQTLGHALLRSGQFAEAESVYRRDLADHPHNGWAMFGLVQALDGQRKSAEATEMRSMFQHAWSRADTQLMPAKPASATVRPGQSPRRQR